MRINRLVLLFGILPLKLFATIGPIPIYLNPVILESNFHGDYSSNSSFAHEVYTKDDIKKSASVDLYDFLTKHSSVSFVPSSGNKFAQQVDLRGFGLTNGIKHISIFLNGRKLNNIDNDLPNLTIIDINSIEKIEIIKGSGSIQFGDNASAGVINIFTKESNNYSQIKTGNYGAKELSFNLTQNIDKFDLGMSGSNRSHNGYSSSDPIGVNDSSNQQNFSFVLSKSDKSINHSSISFSKNEIKNNYPNTQTLEQFNSNPFANYVNRNFTQSLIGSQVVNFEQTIELDSQLKLLNHLSYEDKETNYLQWWGSRYIENYDLKKIDSTLEYTNNNLQVHSGVNVSDGEREGSSGFIAKDNLGIFSKVSYSFDDIKLNAGIRNEKISYQYKNNSTNESKNFHESAYELGINKKLNEDSYLFANLNKSFSSPSVDDLMHYDLDINDYLFKGFIKPTTTDTINIGLNLLNQNTNTKISIFRSNIQNEMYLYKTNPGGANDFANDKNTNLDKSHKYGFELQNRTQLDNGINTDFNYAYIIAKIDSENLNSNYSGKFLPMVSRHNLSLGLNMKPSQASSIRISHKYRSKAFAEEDFLNNFSQKQKAFNSTDFNYKYLINNDAEFIFDVKNIFKETYGTWLYDDKIYPGLIARDISASIKFSF
jgi:iron complex outermembrane receptor protein